MTAPADLRLDAAWVLADAGWPAERITEVLAPVMEEQRPTPSRLPRPGRCCHEVGRVYCDGPVMLRRDRCAIHWPERHAA